MKDKKGNSLKISIVMPVYNSGIYLAEAIESILNQTFTDFEFVIVYDESIDDSYKIIEEYAKKDDRIIILRNGKNLGISEARNNGVKHTGGPAIAVADSDDISLPTRLEKQYNFLEKHKECGAVGSFVELFDGIKTIGIRKWHENDKDLRKRIFLHIPISQPASMIRRNVYDNVGYYDTRCVVAGDLEFWFRMGTRYKFANIQEVLVRWRIHNNSITSSLDSDKIKRMYLYKMKVRKKYAQGYGYSMNLYDKIYNFVIEKMTFVPYSVKFQIFNFIRNRWMM